MELNIITPSESHLLAIGNGSLEIAQSIKIDSASMLEAAGEELRAVVTKKKDLDAQRKAITKPIDDAKAVVMNLFRKPIEFLEHAETVLKRSIGDYQTEQRRIAAEAQSKLDAEAAQARARQEAEAKKLQDEAKKLAQSETPEDAGKAAALQVQAEAMQVAAATTVAPVVQMGVAKVAGVSSSKHWKFRVKDITLVPREYLMLDEQAVGAQVRGLKERTNIPGIEVYEEEVFAARRVA